jgi:hypothetical protein
LQFKFFFIQVWLPITTVSPAPQEPPPFPPPPPLLSSGLPPEQEKVNVMASPRVAACAILESFVLIVYLRFMGEKFKRKGQPRGAARTKNSCVYIAICMTKE